MTRYISVIALLLALALSGCAGALSEPARLLLGANTPAEQAEAAQAITADLIEALRSAEAHEDKIAIACWRGILDRLERVQGSYFTDVIGAASGLQKARNIRRIVTDLNEDIQIACAALVSDTRSRVFSVFKLIGMPVP